MAVGSFSALVASVSLLAAWACIGVLGLARPSSVVLVRRLLFPLGALVGLALAAVALFSIAAPAEQQVLPMGLPDLPFHLRRDALSNVFLFLLGAASAGISLFGAGYFRAGEGTPPGLLCLQYHVFLASMGFVLLADDAYAFMVSWETMALSSYFLVTTQHRIPEIRSAGFLYLLIAHLGRDRDPAVVRRAAGRKLAVHLRRHARAPRYRPPGRRSPSASRCSASAPRRGSFRCTCGCPKRIRPRRRRSPRS